MKIGIPDLSHFNPRRGIGRYCQQLATHWRGWGHTVHELTTRRTSVPLLRNVRWGLRRPLPELDAVLLPDLAAADALVLGPIGAPTAITLHDLGFVDSPLDRAEATLLDPIVNRVRLALAARSCRLVLCDSEFTRKSFARRAPRAASRSRTVYLGVDLEVFRPRDRAAVRQRLRLGDEPLLIYVGAEYGRKNISGLMAVTARCRRLWSDLRLLKVGAAHSARDRAATDAAMERHGLRRGQEVLFIEEPTDDELAELYSAADLYVTTTTYEGFGIPLLEAMACGVPAVASRAGSLPEIGGDAVSFVDPFDVDGFVEAIGRYLAAAPERPHGAGVERASAFRWERTARETLDALVEAASR